MTVYVDDMSVPANVQNGSRVVRGRWSHLMADTTDEQVADEAAAAGLLRDDESAWEWGACLRLNGSAVPGYYQGPREFADEGLSRLKVMHPTRDVVLVRRRAAIAPGPWEVCDAD